jgi:ABC-type Fe3+ transport system permease subunit
MGMLGWVMLGLAIWHYTIFLPDRFWGGIVGAFVGSLFGAIVSGLLIYGVQVGALRVPGERATDIAVVLYAVPGAVIGMAIVYAEGIRRERQGAVPSVPDAPSA